MSLLVALDTIPSAIQLSHVQQDLEPPASQTNNIQPSQLQSSEHTPMSLGGGMPPVPPKLVKRIQEGSFIEMAELSPDLLRNASLPDDTNKSSKAKSHTVGSIIEWIRCFSCYIAIISRSQPQRVVDLLGYQNLIITSHLEFPDFKWEEYDREFRLQASASPIPQWSIMDSTKWNMARRPATHSIASRPTQHAPQSQNPICLAWNEHFQPGCPHRNCRFQHICYRCVNAPGSLNRRHKAIFCPNKDIKDHLASQAPK